MTPLSPALLAVVLALSWGLLLWLYLRKPRLRRTVVAHLRPWEELAKVAGAVRLQRSAARRSWALARALLLATLIAFALADPRLPGFGASRGATLLVLDAGAHMRATDETPTRFAHAQRLAAELLGDRTRDGEVAIAQLASTLTPLSSFSRDEHSLRAAITRARAGDEPTQFEAAAEFAISVLRGRDRPELVLVSDGAIELAPAALERLRGAGIALAHVRVGARSDNLAIRSFAVRALDWDADHCEVFLALENTGARAQVVELTLFEGERVVDVQRVEIAARGRTRQFFTLSVLGPELTARIVPVGTPPDPQPIDDVAHAVLVQPPPRRALLVSDGQQYLERALALDPRLSVDRIEPAAYQSARGYDLVIFDRFAPVAPPEAPSLWLAPPSRDVRSGAPHRVLGSVDRPFFDQLEREEELLRWVSLRDVNVRRAARVDLDPHDLALASARGVPLIITGKRAGQPFVALTFDVRESDLVLRPAWPVFLANAVQKLTATERHVEVPLPLGRGQVRDVPVGVTSATLRAPSGHMRELAARDAEVWIRPTEAGFHHLTTAETDTLLAANPDPSATLEIAPRRIAESPIAPPTGPLREVKLPFLLLLAAALLVLGLDFALNAYRGRS